MALVFIVTVQTRLSNETDSALVQERAPVAESSVALTENLDTSATILAETAAFEVDAFTQRQILEWAESLTLDDSEPVHTEHIQDLPLYRLVNELETKP